MFDLEARAKNIRLAIFDVDGVMTPGNLTYNENGQVHKHFHVHDGQGLKFLQQTGVTVAIITTCSSSPIKKRMQDLGITHVYQGQVTKLDAYEDLKTKLNVNNDQIAYMGDDFPDLPILQRVHLAISVPNAPIEMHKHVMWVTSKAGGYGAVREVCDLIMKSQNSYNALVESFLR